jgi:cobalt-zinc-cadmium efflux system protein
MAFAVGLNLVIAVAEVIGGLASRSLSLLSDALHNFSDGLAVFLSLVAIRVGRRKSTPRRTFGYRRVEILVALLNASVLVVIAVFLFREAVLRLLNPQEIDGTLMLIVAAVGFVANILAVLLLHRGSRASLNIRTAYLHLMADTVSSLAVLFGGVAIQLFQIYWIDPVLTFAIGIYVLREGFRVLLETIDILMQSAPADVDLEEVRKAVERLPEVENLHHVHIWRLSDREVFFEGHVALAPSVDPSQLDDVRGRIETVLTESFRITHTTVQLEFSCCEDTDLIKQRHG